MPAPANLVVAGVNPGGAPWVNGPSPVRVRADGRIMVDVRGLVIPPPRGTGVNPVASVVVTLVCANRVQGSTKPFALSTAGNGRTSDVISVPPRCGGPAVLIQPAANGLCTSPRPAKTSQTGPEFFRVTSPPTRKAAAPGRAAVKQADSRN